MKTHPKIAAILERTNLTPEYKVAVELADIADKKDRSYWGHNNSHKQQTFSEVIAVMHADLLKLGIEVIEGQEADLWLLRNLRQICWIADSVLK